MAKWCWYWYETGFECASIGESIPIRSKFAHFLIYTLGVDTP